jgi:hypothetical protein
MEPEDAVAAAQPKKRGRKRKQLDEAHRIVIQEQRREKNKVSASESRNRRKHYISNLEAEKERLEREKSQLEMEIMQLEARISALDKNHSEIAIGFGEDDSSNLFSASALFHPNLVQGVEEDTERLFDAIFPSGSPSPCELLLGIPNYCASWSWGEEDLWLS